MNEILVNFTRICRDGIGRPASPVAPAGTPEAPTPSAPTPFRTAAQGRRQAGVSGAQHGQGATAPSLIGRKVAVLLDDGVDERRSRAPSRPSPRRAWWPRRSGPRRHRCHLGNCSRSTARRPRPSVVYDAVFVPAGVGAALPRSRWRSVSSMKRIVTASRFPCAPTARRFCMSRRPVSGRWHRDRPRLRAGGRLVKNLGQHRFPRRVSVLKPPEWGAVCVFCGPRR